MSLMSVDSPFPEPLVIQPFPLQRHHFFLKIVYLFSCGMGRDLADFERNVSVNLRMLI